MRIAGRLVPVGIRRNRRARRYILRLKPDGSLALTLPSRGSLAEALQFAARNAAWLERQWARHAAQPIRPRHWLAGMEILFRGNPVRLEVEKEAGMWSVRFGPERCPLPAPCADLRPAIQRHLWSLASRELPARALELGAVHQFSIRQIQVRNQRSRWGSCSPRGVISLNWRLVQTPESVRDYIILHELAHLREMNHSRRFWKEVARLCPDWMEAERWLKQHASLLW